VGCPSAFWLKGERKGDGGLNTVLLRVEVAGASFSSGTLLRGGGGRGETF